MKQSQVVVQFNVPEEIFHAGYTKEQFTQTILRNGVVELVRNQHISESKGAEILGVDRLEMVRILKVYQVKGLDMDETEFQKEMSFKVPLNTRLTQ